MMPAETRIDSHRRVEILRFTLDFLKSFILLSQAILPIIRFRVDAAHCRPPVEWIMCGACCTRLTAYLVSF